MIEHIVALLMFVGPDIKEHRIQIDPDTGKMKQAGRFTTEAVPRVLDIDNTGQFLYSAGLESGHVSAFHIEGDGSLRLISRYEVGKEPMWLLIHATD